MRTDRRRTSPGCSSGGRHHYRANRTVAVPNCGRTHPAQRLPGRGRPSDPPTPGGRLSIPVHPDRTNCHEMPHHQSQNHGAVLSRRGEWIERPGCPRRVHGPCRPASHRGRVRCSLPGRRSDPETTKRDQPIPSLLESSSAWSRRHPTSPSTDHPGSWHHRPQNRGVDRRLGRGQACGAPSLWCYRALPSCAPRTPTLPAHITADLSCATPIARVGTTTRPRIGPTSLRYRALPTASSPIVTPLLVHPALPVQVAHVTSTRTSIIAPIASIQC